MSRRRTPKAPKRRPERCNCSLQQAAPGDSMNCTARRLSPHRIPGRTRLVFSRSQAFGVSCETTAFPREQNGSRVASCCMRLMQFSKAKPWAIACDYPRNRRQGAGALRTQRRDWLKSFQMPSDWAARRRASGPLCRQADGHCAFGAPRDPTRIPLRRGSLLRARRRSCGTVPEFLLGEEVWRGGVPTNALGVLRVWRRPGRSMELNALEVADFAFADGFVGLDRHRGLAQLQSAFPRGVGKPADDGGDLHACVCFFDGDASPVASFRARVEVEPQPVGGDLLEP
ncbi:hypothetical protein HMPREF0972_00508 [Actinomyces sp. oral taxon 848 str. F0332]|nr:hypothetical protein HMPREF0972_00508 [Actinomyces sp. oral taxon 848 str. F0332]